MVTKTVSCRCAESCALLIGETMDDPLDEQIRILRVRAHDHSVMTGHTVTVAIEYRVEKR